MAKKRGVSIKKGPHWEAVKAELYAKIPPIPERDYPLWAGDILHVLSDMRRDIAQGFEAIHKRLDHNDEHDAIDDHAPRDWPMDCPHTSFYRVNDPGEEPLYMCLECGDEFS